MLSSQITWCVGGQFSLSSTPTALIRFTIIVESQIFSDECIKVLYVSKKSEWNFNSFFTLIHFWITNYPRFDLFQLFPTIHIHWLYVLLSAVFLLLSHTLINYFLYISRRADEKGITRERWSYTTKYIIQKLSTIDIWFFPSSFFRFQKSSTSLRYYYKKFWFFFLGKIQDFHIFTQFFDAILEELNIVQLENCLLKFFIYEWAWKLIFKHLVWWKKVV